MSLVKLNWTDFEDTLIDIAESIRYNNGDALKDGQQSVVTGSKAAKLKSADTFLLGCMALFTKDSEVPHEGSSEEATPAIISADGKIGSMLAQISFPKGEHRSHPSFVSAAAAMLAKIAYGNLVELSKTGPGDGSGAVTGYATQAAIIIEEGVKNFECRLAEGLIAAGVVDAVSSLGSADADTLPPNFATAQAVCGKLENAMYAAKEAISASEQTDRFPMLMEALAVDANKEALSALKLHRVLDAYNTRSDEEEAEFIDVEAFRKLAQTEDEVSAALDLAVELSGRGSMRLKTFNRIAEVIATEIPGSAALIMMTSQIKVLLLEVATSLSAQGKTDALEQRLKDLACPIFKWAEAVLKFDGGVVKEEENDKEKQQQQDAGEGESIDAFLEGALRLCVRAVECRAEDVLGKFLGALELAWSKIGKELGKDRAWGLLEKVAELYTASCLHGKDLEELVAKTVEFLTEGMEGSFMCDKDALRTASEDMFTLSSTVVQRRMDINSYVHFLESVSKTFAPLLGWSGARGNKVLIGRFMSKVVHGGVRQTLCGENFFKAILLNWMPVIRVVSGTRDEEGRIALMEMLTRVGELMLLDVSKTEIFMNYAVPLAIRVHNGDATTAAIEETLTAIVTNVDKGLRTFRVMGVLYSFDALLKIAEGLSSEAQEGVRELFRGLISRGRREDIKLATDATMNNIELKNPRYRALLEGVLGAQAGLAVPAKLRMSLFRVLSAAIAICVSRPGGESEEGQEQEQDETWAERAVEYVLAPLAGLLSGSDASRGAERGSITKEDISQTLTGLHKISLFQALFRSDVAEFSAGGKEREPISGAEVMARIDGRFPKEVIGDRQTMEDLMMLGARAVQVRKVRPRFIPVLDDLSRALRVFMEGEGASVGERLRRTHKFQLELPGNAETVKRLGECGYSPCLWKYDEDSELSMTVEVDLRKNIDYGHKSSLEAVYGEYVDILRRLNVSSVAVPDQEGPLATKMLFDGTQYLTLDVVRARKDAALRVIEEKIGFDCREGSETAKPSGSVSPEEYEINCYYAGRVRTLLRREKLIDEQYRNERAHAARTRDGAGKKTFVATLHRSLLGCARCCGSNITGCYAPDGLHAERPIEDGLKAQWGIISLYEGGATGNLKVEVENVEVLFTDQGAYVFKSYTNGHSYDTSMVWIVFFHTLLASGVLPAVIVPNNYPSRPTYTALAQHIPPQLVAAELTFKDASLDGKAERYRPYYDTISTLKPDTIRPGDLILTRDNMENILDKLNFLDKNKMKTFAQAGTLSSSSSSSSSTSSARRLRRDLAGTITTEVLEALNKKYAGHTNLVNAIGRPLAAFVAAHVQCKGACDTAEIRKVIWSDKGKRKAARRKKGKGASEGDGTAASGGASGPLDEAAKNEILRDVVDFVHSRLRGVYSEAPATVLSGDLQRFFEVLSHLRTLVEAKGEEKCPQMPGLDDALTLLNVYEGAILGKIKYQNIGELDGDVRHELMSWIYHNEQKEWLCRGGRDRQESLGDFVSLGGDGRQFPGIVATCENPSSTEGGKNSTVILGYCIGEFVDAETYEVTCAWVDSRARCLRIASTMYLLVLECLESTGRAPGAKVCKRLICDVILGATGRMGFSDLFCRLTMVERRNSWSTGTDAGTTEQFERLVFDFAKVKTCYRVFIATKRVCSSNVVRTVVKYRKPILIGVGAAVGVGVALTLTLRFLRRSK